MPDGGQLARAEIEIDGSPLDAAVEPLVEQVVVDNHVMLPDTFLIVFNDRERDVLGQGPGSRSARRSRSRAPRPRQPAGGGP